MKVTDSLTLGSKLLAVSDKLGLVVAPVCPIATGESAIWAALIGMSLAGGRVTLI